MRGISLAAVALFGCTGGDHFTNLDARPPDAEVEPDASIDAGPDLTGPMLLSTSPASQESDVGTSITITATFDEPIDPFSLENGFIVEGATNIVGTVQVNAEIISFTPNLPLTGGATYTGTLAATITDLAGNPLGADHQFSFTTRAAGWSTPALVESDDTKTVRDFAVADNGAGEAVAAWEMQDCTGATCDGQLDIWVSMYNGSWSSPTVIATGDVSIADIDVAINTAGTATLVWNEYTGSIGSVHWSRCTISGSCTASALLETDDTGYTSWPRIASDGNGNVMAVWDQRFGPLGTPADQMWSRWEVGSSWTTPAPMEAATLGQLKGQIAAAPNGTFVAIWETTDYTVYAKKYTPGSGWVGSPGTELEFAL